MNLVTLTIAVLTTLILGTAAAQEMPEMPKPTKEHELLKQFAGEWQTSTTINMPGMPPMSTSGTETARMVGDFWVMGEHKGDMMGTPFTGIMTLGYDPTAGKYVGTWIDSVSNHMWTYEGTYDESAKVLTLNTQGPCPMKGGEIVKMQDVIELKSPGHKTMTSRMMDNGQWVTGMTMEGHKKN